MSNSGKNKEDSYYLSISYPERSQRHFSLIYMCSEAINRVATHNNKKNPSKISIIVQSFYYRILFLLLSYAYSISLIPLIML